MCRESVNAAITHSFCRKCRIYALFCRKCRDYALFGVEFYAEFLEEILRNAQNFGRNSEEKIGHWSLCSVTKNKAMYSVVGLVGPRGEEQISGPSAL